MPPNDDRPDTRGRDESRESHDAAAPNPDAVESVDADVPDERDGWMRDPQDVD